MYVVDSSAYQLQHFGLTNFWVKLGDEGKGKGGRGENVKKSTSHGKSYYNNNSISNNENGNDNGDNESLNADNGND